MALAAYHHKGLLEAGCDEAGRGCLAAPVVAAAVILPAKVRLPGLDDSKKLTEHRRETLRPLIEERTLAWAIA
ncbi:MAG TPA: ribonuclease HII, partial [Flavobacteriales bacterium]|nr:ribonuclease HII [Flavobacteriales bacterium]